MHKDTVGQDFGQRILGTACLCSPALEPQLEDVQAGTGTIRRLALSNMGI